jgi:hypothetical protein
MLSQYGLGLLAFTHYIPKCSTYFIFHTQLMVTKLSSIHVTLILKQDNDELFWLITSTAQTHSWRSHRCQTYDRGTDNCKVKGATDQDGDTATHT